MKNVNKYEKLTADIKAAIEYASPMLETEDSGTCNCDEPIIFLPRWRHAEVENAVAAAGSGAFAIFRDGWKGWTIGVPTRVRANARARYADAMCNYLERCGYNVMAFQQMD